jgi:Family of unknown function (DUF6064)
MLEAAPPVFFAVIPLLWALAGGSAAVIRLQAPEDLALLAAGIAGFGLMVWRRR